VTVLAAGGALGTTAVQLARVLGAKTVHAVASTDKKRQLALSLGADDAFDYDEELPPTDVVVDGVGGAAFSAAFTATRRFGRLLLLGASSGESPALPSFQQLRERGVSIAPFSFKALRAADPAFVAEHGPTALDLVRRGEVAPVVGERLPLEEAAAALWRLGSRQTVGKLVLQP
jgi:NADPH2:quinone reductase